MQMIIEARLVDDVQETARIQLAVIDRELTPSPLGLSLAKGKALLPSAQQYLVRAQREGIEAATEPRGIVQPADPPSASVHDAGTRVSAGQVGGAYAVFYRHGAAHGAVVDLGRDLGQRRKATRAYRHAPPRLQPDARLSWYLAK